MPTYEYECTKCGRLFELFQSITAKAKRTIETDCRECDNKAPVVRCIGGGAGIIFKGSGFYKTDYRSEGYKKAAKAEAGGDSKGKSETKGKSVTEPKSEPTAPKPEAPAKKGGDG